MTNLMISVEVCSGPVGTSYNGKDGKEGKKEGVECNKRDRLFGIGWLAWPVCAGVRGF